ncbi:MAG: Macrolide-specific efflux protein MacB [Candidatus Jorgensenbacteria bacterium GW2011_GWA1_48_11]|uniref:Macrolide-specific efflux protein MacB n=1 Tax=Candidatus Jorgensenbacteria bacterium GW2011_GWA1_48_11 TaxID=1618660 RepID=A0A0G1UCF3_9BACT|nr:MAG: Macrolide-specific efflux protein MacB [Candidatus Jorgensenbacteria bacterium GW2011_GWA1_48_11]KKW12285.1 MAG: Macrolide-specific efflux protein MacB [Candidatus Jorgensenbacteria bacterium GW2011_GWB1_49_9]
MALIEVSRLEKIYADDGVMTPAVRGVTFEVQKGEFVAIMGPSGSGKSTLLHVLGFLDRQTAGSYRFSGKTIDDYSSKELARVRNKEMGFVFQTFNLLARINVLENVKLPLLYSGIKESLWDHMAKEAIEAVGLSHRLEHESAKLSGGEKQRVAIARALVLNPQVIFADEPTGNLDSKSGQAIMETLQHLNEEHGHTVILITHETYTAEHAQRIIHILDGKIDSDEKVDRRRKSNEFSK